jgi:adhesin HecA-like repeat protein
MFTGCISQQLGAELGARVLAGAIDAAVQPALDLQYASNEFRVAKQRWPQNYDELSSFLKQTDDTTYSSLQTVEFHRIKFTEAAEGKLRIDADYILNSSGKLSGGGTYRVENSPGSVNMEISPRDPDEMTLPRNPKQGT